MNKALMSGYKSTPLVIYDVRVIATLCMTKKDYEYGINNRIWLSYEYSQHFFWYVTKAVLTVCVHRAGEKGDARGKQHPCGGSRSSLLERRQRGESQRVQ